MTDVNPSPGLIPDQLLACIRQENCVLFLGADLPLDYDGAPLSRPELAAALAEKYDLPRGLSWPETAQACLGRNPKDRHSLVSFVMENAGKRAGPLHQAIARAGFRAIVTCWYDEWLEQELRQAGLRVHRVVRDRQLLYSQEGEEDVTLVKLFGCTSDSESLVISERDQTRLIAHLSKKLDAVISFVQLRPLLFAGHDLADQTVMLLYERASEGVVEDMRPAYAVWPQPSSAMRNAWVDCNLYFLDYRPAAFFDALAQQAPAASASVAKSLRVHRPPYKFLDYYHPEDAPVFCRRDTESQIVARLALSHRALTLFGPSGAGKTSLLLAGVLPGLQREEYQHVYVRALDAPLPAVRRAVAARAGRDDPDPSSSLRAFFSALLKPEDRLVILLDQFEELFLRVGGGLRRAFFEQAAAALHEPERDVRFIFSLREDYLASMDEARPYLPDILNNSFRLSALDRSHARVAITEPAARAGVAVEAALVDALVGMEGRHPSSLATPALSQSWERGPGGEGGDLAEADGRIPPAALQIVLDRLYREALPAGHDPAKAPPAGVKLSLAAYRAVKCCLGEGAEAKELHGAQAILADYLDEGLKRMAELVDEGGRPLEADPALGWEMLKAMVTSRSSKAALAVEELELLLEEAGAVRRDDRADRRRLENTRLGLAQVRLARSFERDGAAYLEPAHDHLALAVAARLSQAELGARLARELLRPALENRRLAGQLIPLETLKLIDARREHLRRLNAGEVELLLRSALAVGYEVPYWFERAAAGGVDAPGIALSGLKSESYRARAAAVSALGGLGAQFIPALGEMLADLYPQVRMAAIRALEELQPTGEWRARLKYECYVPAGEFILGDDRGRSDEKPAHKVYLEAYYIGKYPVTNAEYHRYMQDRDTPYDVPAGKEDHPVVYVNWHEARQYAHWAGMRLLSEAEWEKAASWDARGRASRKRKCPWGDEFDKNKCNTRESGIGGTTPVGKYSPAGDGPYGCADMAGNVWEWTSSLYQKYPYRAGDGRDDAGSTGNRVLRGGSWGFNVGYAHCASRYSGYPYDRVGNFGFRCGWGGQEVNH